MIKEKISSCVHPSDGVMAESDKEVELDATKAKLEKVREENEKLKLLLSTVLTDYKSLQMHVSRVFRPQHEASMELDINSHDDFGVDISLRLGRPDLNVSKSVDEIIRLVWTRFLMRSVRGQIRKDLHSV
ncbi:putative WRKY transcription factor 36 [Raphanus sativus]|nr:putative WRKY transcription factor 36 [Raphanus sativus]